MIWGPLPLEAHSAAWFNTLRRMLKTSFPLGVSSSRAEDCPPESHFVFSNLNHLHVHLRNKSEEDTGPSLPKVGSLAHLSCKLSMEKGSLVRQFGEIADCVPLRGLHSTRGLRFWETHGKESACLCLMLYFLRSLF